MKIYCSFYDLYVYSLTLDPESVEYKEIKEILDEAEKITPQDIQGTSRVNKDIKK